MTFTFKLSRRLAGFRAVLAAFAVALVGGCDAADQVGPADVSTESNDSSTASLGGPSLYTAATASGIPFGTTALPTDEYDNTATWNGAFKHLVPGSAATADLAAARQYG